MVVLPLLTLKSGIRQRRSKLFAVGIKLRWRYFVNQSKTDSALIRLSIPIRCLRRCDILPSSKKSVPQESIAKRSSWLIETNIPSEAGERRHHAPRTCAEDRVGGGGIVVYGGSCSADNVFLARACGTNDNEHVCHTRNFLAAGGAEPSGEPQPDRLRRMGKSCARWVMAVQEYWNVIERRELTGVVVFAIVGVVLVAMAPAKPSGERLSAAVGV